jgi:hypothetical protein
MKRRSSVKRRRSVWIHIVTSLGHSCLILETQLKRPALGLLWGVTKMSMGRHVKAWPDPAWDL